MPSRLPVLALLLLVIACSRAGSSGQGAPNPGLGDVMVDVARRFEIAGRAADANRFELAAFEASELEKLFAFVVPVAEMPKEGPTAHIPPTAKAFASANAPELQKAAAAKDRAAFSTAFRNAAAACNACHQASEKSFIQVPTEMGKAVPVLDPLPAASATPR